MGETKNYQGLFATMVAEKASDLFVKVGVPPSIRVSGKMRTVDGPPVTEEIVKQMFEDITNERLRKEFETKGEVDTSYEMFGVGRFRANIFKQKGTLAMVFRHVQSKIPPLEEINIPMAPLQKLCLAKRGLILLTGTAGSGKSTTIASMINYINQNYHKHIITLEDPIEYLFRDDKSVIDQREVGIDTHSFAQALRASLRQSPDIIMIGEMRDLATMEAALNAADTGHLVISTLHTINASQTVERIINFFPPHQHQLLREQLSMLLEGVISMRLLPRRDGKGLIPATEILLSTPTIKELLFNGKTRELYGALKEGAYYGTQTYNQSLKDLYMKEMITLEDAMAGADSPDELKLEIRGIMKGTASGDFDFTKFKPK
jgi:twitching motility protein PilT